MSAADEAWRDWASNEYALPVPVPPEDATPLLETAFMAGYRRALEDAADDVYGDERAEGNLSHPLSVQGWLRDRARAAAVAPRETKD